VWHCHMLEHEDYEMMRPFEIVKRKDRYSCK
jgi:spore coat protein A